MSGQKVVVKYFGDEQFAMLDTLQYVFPDTFANNSAIQLYSQQQINTLRSESHLAANLDSIVMINDSLANVYLYVGQKLKFGKLDWIGIEDAWRDNPVLRRFDLTGQLVKRESIDIITQAISTELDENGYPLYRIIFENKTINADSLSADIKIEPGDKIYFGGIKPTNDSLITETFLSKYLDIEDGDVFQMSKVNNIQKQINQLAYMRLGKVPEIKIITNKAYVEVPLKKVPSSRFDFLIGILPNTESQRDFTISGELTADFKNKFKQGEEIYFHFQQLKPETQKIDFNLTYPYLFNLPFGVHGLFSLYRNGQESRDLNSEIGIQYRSGQNLESRFFINFQSSRLIGIDSMALLNSQRLPQSLDVQLNNLGARFTSDNRDYRFNPRKGLLMELSLSAGIKNIVPNITITDLKDEFIDFSNAYDTIDLSVFQFSTNIIAEYFIPLGGLSTLKLANNTGIKLNQSQVYFNEYYRIGGSNVLRGFDEESIRAKYYSVATAEFRYLLGLNSYFSTFIDYGVLFNEFSDNKVWDQPFGFGIGMSFQTRAGIFGIDVALGREQNNSIDFRNTKTHFGFISLF